MSAIAGAIPKLLENRIWRSPSPRNLTRTTIRPRCWYCAAISAGSAHFARSRASHVDRIRAVHGAVLLPNAACVAGAFLLGFTSLSAVILTNLGTLAIYSGLPRRLRSPAVNQPRGRSRSREVASPPASPGADRTGTNS